MMQQNVAMSLSIFLLLISSSMMVVAWYLHLKFVKWPIWQAIVVSWLIAGAEYCAQVPANRVGHEHAGLSTAHLRAIAEVCVLMAFILFNCFVLKQPLLLNHVLGFAIVVLGVMVVLFGPFTSELYNAKIPDIQAGEIEVSPLASNAV